MSFVIPQVALQKVLQTGIASLKQNQNTFNEIFEYYTCDEMNADYGQSYIDGIWAWFTETKIPVVQAWSFDPQRMPIISIHLAQESEDEGKAALGDHFDMSDEYESAIGTGVFSVNLDIGIHSNKMGDHVLWMYYIVSYVLFRNKRLSEKLGMKLQTFMATDYNKEAQYMADNVWSRWIRFKCTVENMWVDLPHDGPFDTIATDVDAQSSSSADGEIVDVESGIVDIDPTL